MVMSLLLGRRLLQAPPHVGDLSHLLSSSFHPFLGLGLGLVSTVSTFIHAYGGPSVARRLKRGRPCESQDTQKNLTLPCVIFCELQVGACRCRLDNLARYYKPINLEPSWVLDTRHSLRGLDRWACYWWLNSRASCLELDHRFSCRGRGRTAPC